LASLPLVVAPDYLKEWESDAVLSDGATVHVRPVRPDDGDRLVALHGRLSKQSQYFRFFSPKPRLTDKEVERFANVDFVDRAALAATLGDDIIGVARYDRWPGRNEAEVAFTVDDAHQGRGISTLLLEHLSAVARQRGITRFTAEVLPDNRPMLSVFRRAGFEISSHYNEGVVDVAFDIVPTEQFL
jgi:GNAT superfamily N-acetyltransferase